MSDPEVKLDQEASDAIKRIERQMRLEGKLELADQAEAQALGLFPLVLVGFGLMAWACQAIGMDGFATAFVVPFGFCVIFIIDGIRHL